MTIHVCAADFAFRSDASAAVVLRVEGRIVRLVGSEETRPERGKPLKPSVVIGGVAKLAKAFHCHEVWSDFHYSETVREELAKAEIGLQLGPAGSGGKTEVWTTTRALIHEGRVKAPMVLTLITQLKAVRARPTPGGGLSIEQPRRPGSHGDLAAAFALALWAANKQMGWFEPSYAGTRYHAATSTRAGFAPASPRRMEVPDPLKQPGGDWPDDDDLPRTGIGRGYF
jgi:hypothetical protein